MWVVWLDQPACQAVELTGGKAANLSRLAANYPVPPGFCLTTQAYARWAETADPAFMPPELQALLATAYATLAQQSRTAPLRVAVRSSAIGEDSQTASFAGQYATYLNVTGLEAVMDAVTRCWSSAQAERVRAYQQQQGQVQAQPVAVLVQQLIAADVAFVAFSAHPVTGQRDEVVINANWGLGESIVNGTVTPDTYVVRKADWTLTTHTIAEKQRMTVLRPAGVQEVKVPGLLRKQATLTAAQASAIAQLATKLEAELHWPVDIEGAYQGDKLYLLQCRPISTL
jgi:phosphoenolpyruvate synthase/pyruvate phosphate dikinase